MLNPNVLVLKLQHGVALTKADREALDLSCARAQRERHRVDIIREGDEPDAVHLVLDGLACRYKTLSSGQRSIIAYLVPGDFCNHHGDVLGTMDHSIATLTACTIVQISYKTIEYLTANPRIARALWWATLVDESISREWLVNIGRRPAGQQLAHLFCELLVRLKTVGRAQHDSYRMPMTQDELGDSLGISTVHVNRVLQQLRQDELITLQDRMLQIPDVKRLAAFADFNPNYLHLKNRRAGHVAAASARALQDSGELVKERAVRMPLP